MFDLGYAGFSNVSYTEFMNAPLRAVRIWIAKMNKQKEYESKQAKELKHKK